MAFKHFLENIHDPDATHKTKLQQVGDFIEYLNKSDIDIKFKIDNVIKVLDKIKAFDDGYLKQLPYTSKTTALCTYLIIEKLINENILNNTKDEPFVLCDLTYGYGMQFYWVVELLKNNLLHSRQTLITMKYDKYFSIGAYYKEIKYKNNDKDEKLRVYFKEDNQLVDNQLVTKEENKYKIIINLDIKFNKESSQKTKSDTYKKDLMTFGNIIDSSENEIFYIIDKDSNNIFKINKSTNMYQKMAKNKLKISDIENEIIIDIDDISKQSIDITEQINQSLKVDIKKLKLDYEDKRTSSSEIEFFDFKNYDELEYDSIKLKEIKNSVFILDLPSNDIISEDSSIADKLLKNIKEYLNSLNSSEQQIFIISTSRGENDFKGEFLYKGSIKLSGKFMPLTDTAMNLIVLSNANIENFEIDLSNEELLNIEMNKIFDEKREIKQKIVMKDISSQNSFQYEFINQINNKKQNELFTKLSLGDYAIINDTLFKKDNDKYKLQGIIESLSLDDSKVKIILSNDSEVLIEFNNNIETISLNNNSLIFKNYIGKENKDTVYNDYSSKQINDMYKALINKLYKEVN